MATLVIVVSSNYSINDLNDRCQQPTKVDESLEGCRQVLEDIRAGTVNGGSVQVTVRDTAPSISTSGTGSTQDTYSK